MKRLLALLITAVLAFALCACTEAAPSGIENQAANTSASGSTAENTADNADESTGDSGEGSAVDSGEGSVAGNDEANAAANATETDSTASAASDNDAGNAAPAPETSPNGTQWDVPDLFGTWRMVSFTDHYNGTIVSDNGIYNVFNDEMYVYSEISVYTTLQAEYLLENSYDFGESWSDLSVKRFSGELWNGCGNEAWYVELAGKGEIGDPSFYATFADGKLLFMKNVGYDAFSFFESFIAEYERLDVDLQYDRHEWSEWIGDYSFFDSDASGKELSYSISITEHPEWGVLTASIVVEGYETEMTLQAAVVGNANYIELIFIGYGSGDSNPASFVKQYRNNEIILTLTRKWNEISIAPVK